MFFNYNILFRVQSVFLVDDFRTKSHIGFGFQSFFVFLAINWKRFFELTKVLCSNVVSVGMWTKCALCSLSSFDLITVKIFIDYFNKPHLYIYKGAFL